MAKIKIIREGVFVKDARAVVGKTYNVTDAEAKAMIGNKLAESVVEKSAPKAKKAKK